MDARGPLEVRPPVRPPGGAAAVIIAIEYEPDERCAYVTERTGGMLSGMTRITVTMDDQLARAVKATAGDNVSGWLTKLVRAELLRRAVAAEVACDAVDPDYQAWRAERLTEVEQARG